MIKKGNTVPYTAFHIRERDESIGGDNPYKWVRKSSLDIFEKGKYVLFSLPGAFTPTCSTYQLPDFNKLYLEFKEFGIDEIYCISVNDSFVMNAWAKHHDIGKVKVLPDGNGDFTDSVNMIVEKQNLGFGKRSWRYAAIIKDGTFDEVFVEPGMENNHEQDPYEVSSPQNILKYLKGESYES